MKRTRSSALLLIAGVVASGSISGLPARDFSRAFDNLRALGLPDTRLAAFGKVSPRGGMGGPIRVNQAGEMFPGLHGFEAKGNAWRLVEGGENDAGTFSVLLQNAKRYTFAKEGASPADETATWTDVGVDTQWKQISDWLEEPDFLERVQNQAATSGSLLLFAAHLHRNGFEKESNRLAEAILSAAADPEAVVAAAVSLVAEGAYEEALQDLYADQDLKRFALRVSDIADRFGRGWPAFEGVRKMAEKIASQPDTPPPVSAPDGISLTTDHQERAVALSGIEDARLLGQLRYSMGLWLLADERQFERLQHRSGGGTDSPVLSLITSGAAAVPLLVAMLDDDHFLPFPNPNANAQGPLQEVDRLVSEASSGRSADPFSRRNAGPFPRPCTRSDLAAALLAPLVPGAASHTRIEDFRGAAGDWWSEVGGMSRLELARYYFRRGDEQQRHTAVETLIERGEEADFPALEEHLLGQIVESSYTAFNFINQYADRRGEDAALFAKRVRKRANEYLASIKNVENSNYEHYKEQFEESLKTLDNLLSSASAEEMLAQLAAGELQFHAVRETLVKRLDEETREDRLSLVLNAAIAADETIAPQVLYLLHSQGGDVDDDGEVEIATHADQWTKLLDDDRSGGSGQPIGLVAAALMEKVYNPAQSDEVDGFWQRVGKTGTDFLLARARARVAGTPESELASIPSPDAVDDERKDELTEKLLALADDREALRGELEALSLSEQMWVVGEAEYGARPAPEGEEEAGTRPPLQAAVLGVQYSVGEVSAPDGWEALAEWKGDVFSAEKFERFIELGLETAARGESFTARFHRESGFGPLRVEVESATREELADPEQPTGAFVGRMESSLAESEPFVAVSAHGDHYSAFWTGETDDEADEAPGGRNQAMERSRQQIRQTIEMWLQPAVALANDFEMKLFGTTSAPLE
ncbi:MAG: hypothetical protein WD342_14370 [Verrucomicrobiales bacterium]